MKALAPTTAAGSPALKGKVVAALVCTSLVALATSVGLAIEYFLYVPNILLVFLPVVLFAAAHYGFFAAALTSMLSIAVTSYFTVPLYSFAVSDPGSVWALLMFVVVSAYASNLATKIQQRAAAVAQHSRVIEELYAFSSKLASLSSQDELVIEATKQIDSMLHANTVLLLPEHGTLRVHPGSGVGHAALDAREALAATWCWENSRPAGFGTPVMHGASYLYLPLETGRGTVGVIGLHRDPSQPLTAEDSRLLDALRDQVAVSLDRAQLAHEMHKTEMLAETERLRTALLTSISHDLKTPLASILGNVSSLRQYGHLYDDDTRSEMLAYAEDETVRLSRFVENLLQMTRIEAGALHANVENVDISDLIGSALHRSEKLTLNRIVKTDLPADLPMVPLDFVLAEHVLVNLLDNAAKYSPVDSTILLAVTEEPDWLRVTITDEGPGIEEKNLQRIFERFFRAQTGDHRRAGTGLGLAICRGFVEAMGGEVTARNRTDGHGAVFTVMLRNRRSMEKTA